MSLNPQPQQIRVKRVQIIGRRKVEYNVGGGKKEVRTESDHHYSDRINWIIDNAHLTNQIEIESWRMENDKCYMVWTINRDWYVPGCFPKDINQWGIYGDGYRKYV